MWLLYSILAKSVIFGVTSVRTLLTRDCIYRLTSYIAPHTTSFVNDIQSPRTSYLDSQDVLWQYVVSSYTPLVGPRFQSHVSKATLPRAGFLPPYDNTDSVKSLSNLSEFLSRPLCFLSEFLSRLQGDTLRAIFLSLSVHPSFLSRLQGVHPAGYGFSILVSESPYLAMLLLYVPSF